MDLRTTRKSIYKIVWLLMTCAALHDNVVSAQFSGLQEQAIIVGYHGNLSSIQTLQNATTISLACVAFGLPSPQITWQSHDPINTNYTVNITEFKTQIETNGTEFSYTISVLEVCNVSSFTQLSSYTCIADNGVVSDTTPIGEFNRTFLAFTDSVTMGTPDPVTMTTSDEITDLVTMTTNTTLNPTVIMSSVSMTTVIVVVAVIVCVVILSAGVVLVAVLALRRKQKVLKQRSNSENERVYNNSLYGNQTEEQQTTRRSTEDSLYTCEAYSVVPVRPADHEYAYIAPPIALRRSTPPGNTASAAGADSNDISLYPCAAYNPVAINEMQHSYEDTMI